MRRLVTAPFRYFGELGQAIARGWNLFFFTPADPTSLGLVRLVVGLLAFWSLFVYGFDLPDFLGCELDAQWFLALVYDFLYPEIELVAMA